MIRKSLLFALALLIAYLALLQLEPRMSATQAQWQLSVTIAEDYLYRDTVTRNAIVGTSIAERLVLDGVPDFVNLSFAGLSIFDGLNLLRHRQTLPANIFIETNVLLRKMSDNFSTSLFSPVPLFLRRHVIGLRSDKQPLALIGRSLEETVTQSGRAIKHRMRGTAAAGPGDTVQVAAPPPDDHMLIVQWKDNSEKPDPNLLNEQLKLLAAEVSYLMSRGSRVVFFEVPVNPKLMELPKVRGIRESVQAAFPRAQFHYIDLPPGSAGYTTTDGVHLNPGEAVQYTRYFLEEARKFDGTE